MRWLQRYPRRCAAEAVRRGGAAARGRADTSDLTPDGLDEERRFAYSASWQMLEELVDPAYPGTDGQQAFEPVRTGQQFWGHRYIDDAVARRVIREGLDAESNPTITSETYWYLTNHQFSVVGLLNEAGVVVERIAYDVS